MQGFLIWGAFTVAVTAFCVWRPQPARLFVGLFFAVMGLGIHGGLVFWIIGEIAPIRGFHFLQVIYLVTGALVVTWTPARDWGAAPSNDRANPAPLPQTAVRRT